MFALDRDGAALTRKRRGNDIDSWPFFVSFIPYPYNSPSMAEDPVLQRVSLADAIGPDGILVPAGGAAITHYVPLPRDADYQLHGIRYAAYREREEGDSRTLGSRDYLAGEQTFLETPGASSFFTAQNGQRVSWDEMIEVSCYLGSAGDRDYYGGMTWDPATGDTLELPVPLTALQGRQDGPGQIVMGALLMANSVVTFRLRNLHPTQALRVNGTLIGRKVSP